MFSGRTIKNHSSVGTTLQKFVLLNKIIHYWFLRVPFDRVEQKNVPVLIIGSNNVFEVGCNVEACRIGDNNIFESKCFVGNKVTVTNGCIIGAGCYITEEQVLPENTIIYGENCLQREALCGPGVSISKLCNLQFLMFFNFSNKLCKWILFPKCSQIIIVYVNLI